MSEPSIAWLKIEKSQAVRLVEVGDSKRTLWMIGSRGEKIHPLKEKDDKWKTGS
jgi:hypothetical protein